MGQEVEFLGPGSKKRPKTAKNQKKHLNNFKKLQKIGSPEVFFNLVHPVVGFKFENHVFSRCVNVLDSEVAASPYRPRVPSHVKHFCRSILLIRTGGLLALRPTAKEVFMTKHGTHF